MNCYGIKLTIQLKQEHCFDNVKEVIQVWIKTVIDATLLSTGVNSLMHTPALKIGENNASSLLFIAACSQWTLVYPIYNQHFYLQHKGV